MDSILPVLFSMVSIISPCIIFGTCCYLLIKKSSAEAILMTIGSGIGLLINIISLLMPLLASRWSMPYNELSQYYSVIGIIGFIAGICFAAGFLILIYNTVKKNVYIRDGFPKSID